ncbi:hypothetical protein NLG97_g5909 [Lecanicillium saksenae]|uniref:Uncharacterized protein n=1 Tax=Lecanicillium saksenae TaxID=468837 RepID=A0ACC1QSU7_9HYPO|nr:hypothetical protein NLG97_g5909 [Lecanicillium saksenae]
MPADTSIPRLLATQVEKAKRALERIEKLRATEAELVSMTDLAEQLSQAAANIVTRLTARLEALYIEREKYQLKFRARLEDISRDGKFSRPNLFREQVRLIFTPPQPTTLDTPKQIQRKSITKQRAERIRNSSCHAIISWAITLSATDWTGGQMKDTVFEYLVRNAQPAVECAWPPIVLQTLEAIHQDNSDLQASSEYSTFLQAVRNGFHTAYVNSIQTSADNPGPLQYATETLEDYVQPPAPDTATFVPRPTDPFFIQYQAKKGSNRCPLVYVSITNGVNRSESLLFRR